ILSTVNTNLDAKVSTRLATSGYTAPDNSDIAAIKTQTDKLTFDGSNNVEAVLASNGLNNIVPSEPSGPPTFGSSTLVSWLAWLGILSKNKITQTNSTQTVRNNADNANVSTASVSDDGTTFTRDKWS